MKKITLLSIMLVSLLTSCQKEECDGAKVKVTNDGENTITIFLSDGKLNVLPGETEFFKLPKESYQTGHSYKIEGSEENMSFVTVAEPCETVSVSLP